MTRDLLHKRAFLASAAAIVLPFIVFVMHAMLFRNWIVDDAGITFAYARNLAQGNGLVSQPGAAPVEGYSNFTWVALLSPLFLVKLFNPVVTPKVISFILILITFITTHMTFRLITPRFNIASAIVLSLLSINVSFVAWTTSGLENPLLVLLLSQLFYWTVKYNHAGNENRTKITYGLGLIAAFIAMSRPEGIIYFLAFPLLLLAQIAWRRVPAKPAMKNLFNYWTFFAWPLVAFLLFRYFYFGDILPNTFYAKQTASVANLGLATLGDLLRGMAPAWGYFLLASMIAAVIIGVRGRVFLKDHLALALLLLCSLASFSLLEADWMKELRFATGVIFFFYCFAFIAFDAAIASLFANKLSVAAAGLILAVIFIWSAIPSFIERTNDFRQDPIISFNDVGEHYAPWFNRIADRLDIKDGSLLTPDIGGELYYSDLKIYDLGGLCDKTIARAWGKDQAALNDYVYETLKPSFIFNHANWGGAQIEADSRLQQNYAVMSKKNESVVYGNL